jgi:hypothetical protein
MHSGRVDAVRWSACGNELGDAAFNKKLRCTPPKTSKISVRNSARFHTNSYPLELSLVLAGTIHCALTGLFGCYPL